MTNRRTPLFSIKGIIGVDEAKIPGGVRECEGDIIRGLDKDVALGLAKVVKAKAV